MKTNKQHKIITAGLWATCLIVILVGVVVIYDFSFVVKATPKDNRVLNASQPESLMILLNKLKIAIPNKYPQLIDSNQADTTNTIGYLINPATPAIIIPYQAASAVSFTDDTNANEMTAYGSFQDALPMIQSNLEQAGFSALITANTMSSNLETVLFFDRSDAVCQITAYSLLDIYCDSKANIDSIMSLAEPLVTVYNNTNPSIRITAFSDPSILQSETVGYSIASLQIYGSNGETKLNFYRQAKNSWNLVNEGWYNDPHEDAMIEPNCGDFESDAFVRAAFTGQLCYDSATQQMSHIGSH